MHKLSLSIVLFALCLRISTAQNGYNYDRPDVQLSGAGGRPTTPTYQAPSFPPNNQASAPGGGYNYPGPSDDYPAAPTGPAINNAPYPSQGSRPSGPGQFGGIPSQAGGAPYPAAALQPGPTGGSSSYPSAVAAVPTAIAGRPGIGPQATAGFGGVAPTGGAGFGPAVGGGSIPGTSIGSSIGGGSSPSVQNDDASEGDYSAIPGTPDVDYPIYTEIPETSFDCNQQQYPGYYADVEARCQVFHICALNKTFNFLCPNGTIFSQEVLVCVWWNQFDCNSAPSLFGNNANLYEDPQQSSQGQQGAQGAQAGPGAIGVGPGAQSDFVGATGGAAAAPYPAPGRPQAPTSFGSTGPSAPYPSGPSSYQPTGGSSPYPSAGASSPAFPSTQGPYPAAGAPNLPNVPNVPSSSYQPPQGFTPQQNDTPYPAPGSPNRDYLPPRRG